MVSSEYFVAAPPQCDALKPLIAFYYFYETFDTDFSKQFAYFPHYRTALTVHRNSEVRWDVHSRVTTPKTDETTVLLTHNIPSRRTARTYGKIQKICVAFEPLGLNHFTEEAFGAFCGQPLSYFPQFGPPFLRVCETVFNEAATTAKVEALDHFFLQQYRKTAEPRIAKATDLLLHNWDGNVQELAEFVGVSRKTLNRLFRKHVGTSPKEFQKVVKFRGALNQFQGAGATPKLVDVAYDNLYYDQAAFIHHCKKLAGSSPKSLFSSLERVGNTDIFWAINELELSQITN